MIGKLKKFLQWLKYPVLLPLEMTLIFLFVFVLASCCGSVFRESSIASFLALLVMLALPGLPAFFIGAHLLNRLKKLLLLVNQSGIISAERDKKGIVFKLASKFNFFAEVFWRLAPVTISVLLLYFLVNFLALFFFFDFFGGFVAKSGSEAFAASFVFTIFFFAFLVIPHFILIAGGLIGFVIDSLRFNKNTFIKKPVESGSSPVLLALFFGMIPTILIYAFVTTPLWWPAFLGIVNHLRILGQKAA